jgi:hypothetical protein
MTKIRAQLGPVGGLRVAVSAVVAWETASVAS